MGLRCRWLLVAVLLVPAGAHASGHNWDVFFAPGSFLRLNGAKEEPEASAKSLRAEPSTNPWLYGVHSTVAVSGHSWPKPLTLVFDFSSNFSELDAEGRRDLAQATLMAGPRWTFLHGKFLPLVQVMPLGYTHNGGGGEIGIPDGAWAFAVGTGFEFVPGGGPLGEYGIRVQYDRLLFSRGKPQDRISLGIILRFAELPEDKDRKDAARAAQKAAKEAAKGTKKDQP